MLIYKHYTINALKIITMYLSQCNYYTLFNTALQH